VHTQVIWACRQVRRECRQVRQVCRLVMPHAWPLRMLRHADYQHPPLLLPRLARMARRLETRRDTRAMQLFFFLCAARLSAQCLKLVAQRRAMPQCILVIFDKKEACHDLLLAVTHLDDPLRHPLGSWALHTPGSRLLSVPARLRHVPRCLRVLRCHAHLANAQSLALRHLHTAATHTVCIGVLTTSGMSIFINVNTHTHKRTHMCVCNCVCLCVCVCMF